MLSLSPCTSRLWLLLPQRPPQERVYISLSNCSSSPLLCAGPGRAIGRGNGCGLARMQLDESLLCLAAGRVCRLTLPPHILIMRSICRRRQVPANCKSVMHIFERDCKRHCGRSLACMQLYQRLLCLAPGRVCRLTLPSRILVMRCVCQGC